MMLPVHVNAEKNVAITVLSNISEDTMKPYLNAFQKKYPGINVKYYSYSDYENELQTRMDKVEVAALFDKLVKAMERDLDYQEKIKHLSIGLGAAYTGQKMPMDVLLKSADKVLYMVKELGKNNWNMDVIE